jgi:hypothetical protein
MTGQLPAVVVALALLGAPTAVRAKPVEDESLPKPEAIRMAI